MTLESLATGAALVVAILVGGAGFIASRRWAPAGPRPGLWDLAHCVGALLWGTAWGTLVAGAATGQGWAGEGLDAGGDPPMLPAVIGSAVGGACAVAVALARLGPARLGLGRPPTRWL